MSEQIELRFNEVTLKSTKDGLRVSGYVNKTNQWSETLGVRKKFVERIMPGTFQKAMQRGNEIHFLAEHDNSKILASTRNDSLTLREDENGLWMEATIAPTSWGKDYHTLIKEGIIRNMSFGMKVLHDSWKKLPDGLYERSIDDLYLAEVSAVRSPAYAQSSIAARSIDIVEDPEMNNLSKENENHMSNLETYRNKLADFETEDRKEPSIVVKQVVSSFEERLTETEIEAEKRALEGIIKGETTETNEDIRSLTSTENGYLVPTVISNHIVEKVHHNAKLFNRVKKFEPVNGFLEILRETEEIGTAGFFGEMNTNNLTSDFTMNKIRLSQKRVGSVIELSDELVNDSGVNILEYAINVLSRRQSILYDERILHGSVEDSPLNIQGIIPYKLSTGDRIFKSTSKTEFDFDILREMMMSLNPQYAANGFWVMHYKTFAQLTNIKDDTGFPIILNNKLTDAPKHELFGRPIVFCDSMNEVGAGKTPILFGDFGEGYGVIVKKDVHLQHIYKDRISRQQRIHTLLLDQYLDGKVLNEDCFAVLKMAD